MDAKEERAQQMCQMFSDYVNKYSSDNSDFLNKMSNDHRTLQQAFTRLCFQWIERVARDDYRVDARNADSKEAAKAMVTGFLAQTALIGFRKEIERIHPHMVGANPEDNKPSQWLAFI